MSAEEQDRLLSVIREMRKMVNELRQDTFRLRDENIRLRRAVAVHGLDLERILS